MTTSSRETPEAALRRLRARLQIEAAEIAINALIEVARSPSSTAQARATAGTSLLRAAGFFDRDQVPTDKEAHEMTAAELEQEIKRMTAPLAQAQTEVAEGSVFE